MRRVTACVLGVLIAGSVWIGFGRAENFASLGYREDTVIGSNERDCVGTLVCNHDYSFENAYCWQYDGVAPPYYGALAEGYDLGSVTVECGVFWLTEVFFPWPPPADIYIWDGGVDGPPTNVLCMVGGIGFAKLPTGSTSRKCVVSTTAARMRAAPRDTPGRASCLGLAIPAAGSIRTWCTPTAPVWGSESR
jgi:hypothetical protein